MENCNFNCEITGLFTLPFIKIELEVHK